MFDDVLSRLGLSESSSGVCGRGWVACPTGDTRPRSTRRLDDPSRSVHDGLGAEDYDRVGRRRRDVHSLAVRPRAEAAARSSARSARPCASTRRDLGLLVTLETGKIRREGRGEVQEMIDMCDFAVGLSRQLHGLTIASERPEHRMIEQWHPLGPVGIITAFNFPVAVWAWNAMIAAVCGDTMVWKPSPETPLTAIAVQHIVNRVCRARTAARASSTSASARPTTSASGCSHDARLPLISATGSCRMGRRVGEVVGRRLGRSLLELGGNNAVDRHARAPTSTWPLRGIVFAAVGTAGQRCTTLRRLIVHESIADAFLDRLVAAYRSLPIGDPWEDGVLIGPLINERAVDGDDGGARCGRGRRGARSSAAGGGSTGPASSSSRRSSGPGPTCRSSAEETFAPILYVMTYRDARRGDRDPERRRAGAVLGHLHRATCARPSGSSRPRAPTAASPTSTSAPRARRSAAPSAARRPPAAAARRARTPGRPTCAGRPARSTAGPTCRWPRAYRSPLRLMGTSRGAGRGRTRRAPAIRAPNLAAEVAQPGMDRRRGDLTPSSCSPSIRRISSFISVSSAGPEMTRRASWARLVTDRDSMSPPSPLVAYRFIAPLPIFGRRVPGFPGTRGGHSYLRKPSLQRRRRTRNLRSHRRDSQRIGHSPSHSVRPAGYLDEFFRSSRRPVFLR